MKKFIVVLCFAAITVTSCNKKFAIEERALNQLPIAVSEAVNEFSYGAVVKDIQNIKTIYVNDSICIVQCSALFENKDNSRRILDYRYTYLIDRVQSFTYHKPIFLENISNTLCMPDDIIKQSRKDVRSLKESVYDKALGSCSPIRNSYDGK